MIVENEVEVLDDDPVYDANDEAMQGLYEAWQKLKVAGEIDEELALEDYLDVDDEIITGGVLSINEILEKYATEDEFVIEEAEMEEIEEPSVTSLDAMRALQTLRQYVERNFNDPATLHLSV